MVGMGERIVTKKIRYNFGFMELTFWWKDITTNYLHCEEK